MQVGAVSVEVSRAKAPRNPSVIALVVCTLAWMCYDWRTAVERHERGERPEEREHRPSRALAARLLELAKRRTAC